MIVRGIRLFEFISVFDEIRPAHRLFSFRASIDDCGLGADASRNSRPVSAAATSADDLSSRA